MADIGVEDTMPLVEEEEARNPGHPYVQIKEAVCCRVGNDPRLLRKRIDRARGCLHADFAKLFRANRFEPKSHRMVSGCGRYVLQWLSRPKPDKPVDYHNQQTLVGCVIFAQLEVPCPLRA